jgi:predicted HicB family RNase H-like nuclease
MNVLTYKGYSAAVEFDADDLILAGRVAGLNDVVGFHGATPQELVAAFHEAVDDYVATCKAIGKAPEKPYSGKVMLRVDPSVHAQIALASQLSGMSINQLGEEGLRLRAEQVVRERVTA